MSLRKGLRLTTPPACLHSLPPSRTTVRSFSGPQGLAGFQGTFSTGVLQDSGGRYAVYHVHVKCQHTQVPVVEEWVTKRRYSDFHDLYLTLRTQVSSLSLSLPPSEMKFPPPSLHLRWAMSLPCLHTAPSTSWIHSCWRGEGKHYRATSRSLCPSPS